MPPLRRRRRVVSGRRRRARGTGLACALGGLALLAVMGVTIVGRTQAPRAVATVVAVPCASPAAPAATPRLVQAQVATPLGTARDTVLAVERGVRGLRTMDRGPGFDRARVEALARLSGAREDLGAWLDAHPRDDRANRLWDRLQLVYVLLKKL